MREFILLILNEGWKALNFFVAVCGAGGMIVSLIWGFVLLLDLDDNKGYSTPFERARKLGGLFVFSIFAFTIGWVANGVACGDFPETEEYSFSTEFEFSGDKQ